MKGNLQAVILAAALAMAACHQPSGTDHQTTGNDTISTKDSSGLTFKLIKVADSLPGPVALENAHDGTGRLFVGGQGGAIWIIKNGKPSREPFLDIRRSLVHMEDKYMDVGLLGFAFHPDYKHNGRFFVHYSAPPRIKGYDNKSVLAEYHVSTDNPDKAVPTGKVLLIVDQPEENHNGGNIVFGKDGYLYMGFGDGGGQGDKHGTIGNGQDLNQLLGKIIRIDVNHGAPYKIPPDNPFVGKKARPEIWAYGMRMPWRISFDSKTGELFCGDVGQDTYEEVDIIEKGLNYGWRAMEGFHIYDTVLYNRGGDFIRPIAEYKHTTGVSITGGFVYRGSQYPAMEGKYIFADWAFKVFYLQQEGDKWAMHDAHFEDKKDNVFPFRINSFGQGEDGEIYMVTQNDVGALNHSGVIYKITAL
ncbi:PQQ-dependent sugar dehydrogenase [Chitinophaga agrisoli]|uniref:PQQ-dependent sugar dehydrogenase n=1 Tax=Chitinophaga agrisoli TaxID=2607653 RepID=A0A5B2VRC3_9BACT|nr:PQQ-dependent sugar dehydrogenase [Chitinophaga agrisoli]KAA2240727.1 PQQ-dependent sugar dehydrogenase [Chitinophaga agrisoli]